MSSVSSPWFSNLGKRVAPECRLFCFPYAGGGASAFRLWPQHFAQNVEVLAVQLPGRESRLREKPLNTVGAMVDLLLPEIANKADIPFAIFGHSMGTLLAYELTVALEQSGGPAPFHLFVSGRRGPDEADPSTAMHPLHEEAFLDAMQLRYGGIPPAARNEPELMALLLPSLRADVHANETYRSDDSRKVRCPVAVYGGSDDRHPTPSLLEGWQRVAEQPIRVRLFSGDHFYLAAQRDALTADIASAMAATARSGAL